MTTNKTEQLEKRKKERSARNRKLKIRAERRIERKAERTELKEMTRLMATKAMLEEEILSERESELMATADG